MSEESYVLEDGETVDAVYLADDAVEDFLIEGQTYDVAHTVSELGLGPFYSTDTFDRISDNGWTISFRELRNLGTGYEERPTVTPEWYDGDEDLYNLVEVAKFPGEQDNNILIISELEDIETAVERRDYMEALSPEDAAEEFLS